jgi:hypothetical protein
VIELPRVIELVEITTELPRVIELVEITPELPRVIELVEITTLTPAADRCHPHGRNRRFADPQPAVPGPVNDVHRPQNRADTLLPLTPVLGGE